MTEVRIVDSLKYGGRLFVYLLGAAILGGGGIALGLAVGYNSVSIRGTGGDPVIYDTPELIAGVVLASLGVVILFTGLLGLTHKLIADSVATGVERRELTPPTEQEAGVETTDEVVDTETAPAPSSPTATSTSTGVADEGATASADQHPGAGTGEPAAEHASQRGETKSGVSGGVADARDSPEPDERRRDTPPQSAAAGDRDEDAEVRAQPTREASTPEGSDGEDAVEADESDDWGQTPAREHDQHAGGEQFSGNTPGDEEFKERTAEEIAFGVGQSEDDVEQSGDTGPDGRPDSEASDDKPSGTGGSGSRDAEETDTSPGTDDRTEGEEFGESDESEEFGESDESEEFGESDESEGSEGSSETEGSGGSNETEGTRGIVEEFADVDDGGSVDEADSGGVDEAVTDTETTSGGGPAESAETSGQEGSPTASDDAAETAELFGESEAPADDDDEETVVPEYDEISEEDSEGDPLGEPFEDS